MTYIVSTTNKTDLFTTTNISEAEQYVAENKKNFSYLQLSKLVTNPYKHNGKYTVKEVIKCYI